MPGLGGLAAWALALGEAGGAALPALLGALLEPVHGAPAPGVTGLFWSLGVPVSAAAAMMPPGVAAGEGDL